MVLPPAVWYGARYRRCRYLGEALRAVLVAEVRQAVLVRTAPCDRPPAHLPPGCGGVRLELRSAGGALVTVTLGGPMDLLRNKVGG